MATRMVSPYSPFQESFRNTTIIDSIDNAPQNERKKTAFSSPFRSALLIRQRRIYPYAFLENLLILAATEAPIPPSRGDRRWGDETENRKHARVTSAGDEEERPESNRHSAPPRRNHACGVILSRGDHARFAALPAANASMNCPPCGLPRTNAYPPGWRTLRLLQCRVLMLSRPAR